MISTFSTEKMRFDPTGGYVQRFLRLPSVQQIAIVRAEVECDKAWRAAYAARAHGAASLGVAGALDLVYSLAQAKVVQLRRALVWKGFRQA